jgi:hypothetical protein
MRPRRAGGPANPLLDAAVRLNSGLADHINELQHVGEGCCHGGSHTVCRRQKLSRYKSELLLLAKENSRRSEENILKSEQGSVPTHLAPGGARRRQAVRSCQEGVRDSTPLLRAELLRGGLPGMSAGDGR